MNSLLQGSEEQVRSMNTQDHFRGCFVNVSLKGSTEKMTLRQLQATPTVEQQQTQYRQLSLQGICDAFHLRGIIFSLNQITALATRYCLGPST